MIFSQFSSDFSDVRTEHDRFPRWATDVSQWIQSNSTIYWRNTGFSETFGAFVELVARDNKHGKLRIQDVFRASTKFNINAHTVVRYIMCICNSRSIRLFARFFFCFLESAQFLIRNVGAGPIDWWRRRAATSDVNSTRRPIELSAAAKTSARRSRARGPWNSRASVNNNNRFFFSGDSEGK